MSLLSCDNDSTSSCKICRSGVWKTLRILDSVYNSILGRGGTAKAAKYDERRLTHFFGSVPNSPSDHQAAVDAMFSICPFLDELEHNGSEQSVASLESFLHRLQQWSKNLPDELRRYSGNPSTRDRTATRELYLGAAHVACIYYFTIILATRRYLTLHLLPQVRRRYSNDRTPQEQSSVVSLAQVCLNAAISLSQVGYHAMQSQKMLKSMCIMKFVLSINDQCPLINSVTGHGCLLQGCYSDSHYLSNHLDSTLKSKKPLMAPAASSNIFPSSVP